MYKEKIKNNYENVLTEIRETCLECNADFPEIMAVTKFTDIERIQYLCSLGCNIIGENYAKEYREKLPDYPENIQKHFIGHIQTKQLRYIVGVDCIQSVDGLRLAEEIDKIAEKRGIVQNCLLEVNIGKEESKTGILPEHLPLHFSQFSTLKNCRLTGLMFLPPYGKSDYYFPKIKELFLKYQSDFNLKTLSCGTSDDYILSIKQLSGKNYKLMLRLGTAFFGQRKNV